MWIKFTETSSALGGIFAALYIHSSETLWLLQKDVGFLKGDFFFFFDKAGVDFTHSSQNSVYNTVRTTQHFKAVREAGLFGHW